MNREHEPILEVKDLTVSFQDGSNTVDIVHKVSFTLYSHETLALVGESGCGKSLTAQAIIGLFSSNSVSISGGEIIFCGENIRQKPHQMQKIRGLQLSFIQQNPLNSLNPTLTIGTQLFESIKMAHITTKEQKKAACLEMLKLVGISDGEKRLSAYPHELSGGMRQRVLIAMALINRPKLLIADEPTTALDVTIQAQILDLLAELQGKTGTSILFITHDMGAVAHIANRVAVMYGGKIVETGSANEIFYTPQHPYTQMLLTCLPRLDIARKTPKPISGAPPLPGQFKTMCPFLPRCPYAMKICAQESPGLFGQEHQSRCWRALSHEK
ncbi:MAG: ABC transporter ATP-binding protein [Verrucomicrobia bacterium]|nr:ABC transporter ATP-binding protein [Verrucomicrobiota bacterium]